MNLPKEEAIIAYYIALDRNQVSVYIDVSATSNTAATGIGVGLIVL